MAAVWCMRPLLDCPGLVPNRRSSSSSSAVCTVPACAGPAKPALHPSPNHLRPTLARPQLKRLLAWQLPPRGFLAGWCGGLCVGEGLLVALWLGINGWWFGQAFTRNMGELFQDTWQERVGK